MNFQPQILALLEASLLRPLVLVAAAWLILRLLRVRHPASRHAIWTAVLAGMLAVPFISVITPDWTLRVLPWTQPATEHNPERARPVLVAENDPVDAASLPILPQADTSSVPRASFAAPSVESLIVWGYSAGLLVMLTYRLLGWMLLRRVVSRSKALRPSCLRESDDVITPVAVGLLRPSVILPANWRDWSARTKRAVLAHEFEHLRRRDTLVAALARLVKCVFWFHPVAWWVSRQTSDMAELACDAVALQRVGDPAGYSRVLVEFASAVNRSGQRVALPGLAIASSSRMGERVDQVFELSGGTMKRLPRPGVWLVTMGLPALSLAATVVLSASAPFPNDGASAGHARSVAGAGDGTDAAQKPASKPRFEAATIKPCPPEDTPPSGGARGTAGGTNATFSPGRFAVPCVTTEQLIYLAYASYGVRPEEQLQNDDPGTASSAQKIRGGPDWVHSTRDKYMIEAIAPGVTERTTLMGSMLQTLLEERFQLKLHRESEEVAMFALTVAKSGFKLKPMKDGECDPTSGPPPEAPGTKPRCGNVLMRKGGGASHWTFSGSPISSLASMLSKSLGIHVIDRTNITDRFMMQFNFYMPDGSSKVLDASGRDVTDQVLGGPSVDQALNDQLGLKLDRLKAPREYIVIDRIQRPTPDDQARQAPPLDQTPTFDVVSIKPCPGLPPPGGRGIPPSAAQISPGYVHWDCVTLSQLIDQAYAGVENPLLNMLEFDRGRDDTPRRVRGGPSWVESDLFTIEAKGTGVDVSGGTGPRRFLRGATNAMVRALLEDRFQLKLRRATEQQPMYVLSIAPGGLNKDKVTPTKPDDCWTWDPPTGRTDAPAGFEKKPMCGNVNSGAPRDAIARRRAGADPATILSGSSTDRRFEYTGLTMEDVAEHLSTEMDHFVLDKTGLQGPFNFAFEFASNEHTPGRRSIRPGAGGFFGRAGTAPGAAAEPAAPRPQRDGPNIFKALEALGLKLEPTKGPAEYLVIDSVQRPKPNHP